MEEGKFRAGAEATALATAIALNCGRALTGEDRLARYSAERFVLDLVGSGRGGIGSVVESLAVSDTAEVRRFAIRCIREVYWSEDSGAEAIIGRLMLDNDSSVAALARATWEEIRYEMMSVSPRVLVARGLRRLLT